MGRSRLVRIGLLYLAASAALVGLWALAAPKSWHDSFPGLGMHWASAQPPYNEHLVRDVGGFYTGFMALFLWAAWRPARNLVVPLCWAWAALQVPHLVFHVAHDEGMPRSDWLLQTTSLAGLIAVAVAVALVSGRERSAAG